MVKITCDSAADLPKEILERYDISVIPFVVVLGNEERYDGDVTPKDIFEFVNKTNQLPRTTAINEYSLKDFFEKNLGDDGLVHITLSSGLSCTYESAKKASEELENVYVIDSKSLSSGEGMQVIYACELAKQGLSAKEIVEKVEARREKTHASFVTWKLDYLHKGGRCSSVALLGANILKIRPSILVANGGMVVHKKYMGKMEKVLEKYIIDTLAEFDNPVEDRVYLTYSSATPEMLEVARNTIREQSKFKEICECTASSTITAHCGENTIGILYYRK